MKEFSIILRADNYLVNEHRMDGLAVLPGMAYLDILARCLQHQQFSLSQITYPQAAVLKEGESIRLCISFDETSKLIQVHHEESNQKIVHFRAFLILSERVSLCQEKLDYSHAQMISMEEMYDLARTSSIVHGEFMRVSGTTQIHSQSIRMQLRLSPKAQPFLSRFYLHPALLEGATFAIAALHYDAVRAAGNNTRYLPLGIDKIHIHARITGDEIRVHAQMLPSQNDLLIKCRMQIFSIRGELLVELDGLTHHRSHRSLSALPRAHLDSLVTELAEALSRAYGQPMNSSLFFELQTTGQLEAYLANLPNRPLEETPECCSDLKQTTCKHFVESITALQEKENDDLLIFNQALNELEHFCFHLVKYKLVTQGLIWSEFRPSFISALTDYADYFIAFLSQLKEFEKTQHAAMNKNQIKTWDGLLQQRLELSKKYPAILPFLNLLAVCTDQLVCILRGEISIQEVVFPYGQDHLVRAIHQDNPLVNYYNQLMAKQVEKLVAARYKLHSSNGTHFNKELKTENSFSSAPWAPSPHALREGNMEEVLRQPLRILELGAGFGATTAAVLKRCKQGVHYIFSDSNPQLVSQARMKFGHHPGFQALVVDINKPILNHAVDVIIAANVLHTADAIHSCLMGIRSLLKAGGLLMITETTANSLFLASSFGLFKQWHAFKDEHRIKASPLMTVSTWKWILEDLGFEVHLHPTSEGMHQSLILATFPFNQ